MSTNNVVKRERARRANETRKSTVQVAQVRNSKKIIEDRGLRNPWLMYCSVRNEVND